MQIWEALVKISNNVQFDDKIEVKSKSNQVNSTMEDMSGDSECWNYIFISPSQTPASNPSLAVHKFHESQPKQWILTSACEPYFSKTGYTWPDKLH